MEFQFYYGSQADQFSFIRIPRIIITEKSFAELSLQAKMLYSVLLDRMSLSRKNGWFDEENRVFIIYPISEIQEDLGISKKKAMNYLSELENFGLVQKKKRGFGLPSIIYVKNFMLDEQIRSMQKVTSESLKDVVRSPKNGTSRSVKCATRGEENGTTEVLKSALLEVPKEEALKNKTYKSDTNRSKTESNPIVSEKESDEIRLEHNPLKMMNVYEKVIKKNIEYEILMERYPGETNLVRGILQLIVEVMMAESEKILIASEWYPTEMVKSKMMKLNYVHIDYVLLCLQKNTTKIKNIKKYLLAALFNATSTMDGYYRAEVNHDMAHMVQ